MFKIKLDDMRFPSRTITQEALHIISILMIVIALTLMAWTGVSLVVSFNMLTETTQLVHLIDARWLLGALLGASALLCVTGALGIRAATDAAKIESYRFLCYLVGLIILLVMAQQWSSGEFLLFNPIVLILTIVYVLVCSSLADRVSYEYHHKVEKTVPATEGTSYALQLVSELLCVKSILGVLVAIMWLVARNPEAFYLSNLAENVTLARLLEATPLVAEILFTGRDGLVGLFGIWSLKNRFRKKILFGVSLIILLLNLTYTVYYFWIHGAILSIPIDVLLDILLVGAQAVLSYKLGVAAYK